MSETPNDTVFFNAAWSEEGGHWFVESSSYPGLHAQAASLDRLILEVREALRELRIDNDTHGVGGHIVLQATIPA